MQLKVWQRRGVARPFCSNPISRWQHTKAAAPLDIT